MDSIDLHILPVYSEYQPSATFGAMPLLRHQAETLAAFRDPAIDVIFNEAMTGDGKSLAAYLPALEDEKTVIAMYPTNELIQDQLAALPGHEHHMRHPLPPHTHMYSDTITNLMLERDEKVRVNMVRSILRQNEIVLTNPDLVHLMLSHQYGWGHQRKELPAIIGAFFDYLVFDEFHVFGVPQIVAVMNMLGYLATNYAHNTFEGRKKYLFLSATPSSLIDTLLTRSGLCYKRIKGRYSSSASSTTHRRILQECQLRLHEVSQETPTETWMEGHLDDLHAFFRQQPEAKAAILVSSVATARRLYSRLCGYFEPHGITVGENTGLTSTEKRHESLSRQVLVATSTVDVGVDFHINYLVFEAFDAGSFLQRFGRLGRHDEFSSYHAHALIPRFVLERLNERVSAVREFEREAFNALVREAFPQEQVFNRYIKLWGEVQAAQVLVELKGSRDENTALVAALSEQYERLYGGTVEKSLMGKARNKYWRLQKQRPEIVRELQSLRGQSPLSCGVWDIDDHLQTYDLFFLLANTEFECIDESSFFEQVRVQRLPERPLRNQLLYLKIHRYVPERMQLILKTDLDLSGAHQVALEHAEVINAFSVLEPRHTWLDQVNKCLGRKRLVCTISHMHRTELKQRCHLGPLFPVYHLQDKRGDEYSIVFGQEALLLDSILYNRPSKGENAIMA